MDLILSALSVISVLLCGAPEHSTMRYKTNFSTLLSLTSEEKIPEMAEPNSYFSFTGAKHKPVSWLKLPN